VILPCLFASGGGGGRSSGGDGEAEIQIWRDVTRFDIINLAMHWGDHEPMFSAKGETNPTLQKGDAFIVFYMGQRGVDAWKQAGKLPVSEWLSAEHAAEVVFAKEQFDGVDMKVSRRFGSNHTRFFDSAISSFYAAGFVISTGKRKIKEQAKLCPQVEYAKSRKAHGN